MPNVLVTSPEEGDFAGHIDTLGLEQYAEGENAEDEEGEGLELNFTPDTLEPMLCVGTIDMGSEDTPVPRSRAFVAALDMLRQQESPNPIFSKIEFLVRPGSENSLMVMLRIPEEDTGDDGSPAEVIAAMEEVVSLVEYLELRYETDIEEALLAQQADKALARTKDQEHRTARKVQKAARRKARK